LTIREWPTTIRLHIEARLERGEPVYEEVKTSTIRVEV
jgi:hypothetical protein